MASLNKITIKGFKSIKELNNFELTNLNVLIGANGVGKSNFISAFEFLNSISEEKLQRFVSTEGGSNNILYNGIKTTQDINLRLEFGQNGYLIDLTADNQGNIIISDESCYFHNPAYARPYEIHLSSNSNETGLLKSNQKIANKVSKSIKSWKVYHFHDTSDTSPMRQYANINDNDFLKPDGSNLASFLYLLKEKFNSDYRNIIDVIRLVAPFFKDFILRPRPENNQLILLEWEHTHSDQYFNVSSLSDGSLRFIALAVLLMQPQQFKPTSILLDEPELGLHPYAINVLANLFRSVSTNTQIIVSTQSVTLVNQLRPEDLIVVEQENTESKFRRIKAEEMKSWIDDYGLGDLWEKNIFGGRP